VPGNGISSSRSFVTRPREVIDKSRPMADVARESGVVAQTLGHWVNAWRAEQQHDIEPDLSISERPNP